ncbi:MAG TPA: hypothetical protein HA303_04575, partial [Candidatus Thalassarchaeaceae archaeon]
ATNNPELVKLDLGGEWFSVTGLPMVFGVFACRRDAPIGKIKQIRQDLLSNYDAFNSNDKWREEV